MIKEAGASILGVLAAKTFTDNKKAAALSGVAATATVNIMSKKSEAKDLIAGMIIAAFTSITFDIGQAIRTESQQNKFFVGFNNGEDISFNGKSISFDKFQEEIIKADKPEIVLSGKTFNSTAGDIEDFIRQEEIRVIITKDF